MTHVLIIAEKPQAALKIATALADKKVEKIQKGKVSYYNIQHNGKQIFITPAVGHLYNLAEIEKKKGWSYPVFEITWKESALVSRDAKFTKPYLDLIKSLAKSSDSIIVATDKDLEGELIGYNIVRFACHKKDAQRMEFSTLTQDEIVSSFEHAKPHLDFPLANSAEVRHTLDHFWGVNLSRALTLSIKHSTGMFKLLSTGRVQGPTLKILYEREKEIQAFKPEPYWELELIAQTKKKEQLHARHDAGKFNDRKKAEAIQKKCKNKDATVTDITAKTYTQKAPTPFDLTSLQIEAYSTLGLSPQRTLDIAQDLYSNGWISYPRTSSQKLPESIGYKKILQKLAVHYPDETQMLLSAKKLIPNNGKKEDPAHPAIYPTGETPRRIEDKTAGLYELIVRRFFATFGENATRETVTITLTIADESFNARGTRTTTKGWHTLYGKFLRLDDEELPLVTKNEKLNVEDLILHDKETKPPARYTEASLIKEMEKLNVGTKATRSTVMQNLYDRNYILEKSIRVTELGMKTIDTLEKYSPEVLDVALTRKFEEEMDAIQEGKKKGDEIITEAKTFLTKALTTFKKNEKAIGKELGQAAIDTRDAEIFLGKCPVCKEGNIQIRKGKYGLFGACDRYDQGCVTTLTLPKTGKVKGTEKRCLQCSYPIILLIRARRKPQEFCINPNCPPKKAAEDALQKVVQGKKCPKCGKDLIVRKSFYGAFIACPGFPSCRYIEQQPKT